MNGLNIAVTAFASIMFFSAVSFANEISEHSLVRRVTVFPLMVDVKNKSMADKAWWDIREALTDNRRFLVASKNFMKNKDVFQPRGVLSPADAIILGRLLDAHALITTHLQERTLRMNVYEGVYGRLLWSQEINLHPSLPAANQLSTASLKLVHDFMASIPYQGHVIANKRKGRVLFRENGRNYVMIKVGIDTDVKKGDEVQFLRISSKTLKPLFVAGAEIKVFAQGVVNQVNDGEIIAEVSDIRSGETLQEESLVRLPKDFKRLQESYAIRESIYKNIDPAYLTSGKIEKMEKEKEYKPLVSSLGFFGNLALILLLAF